MRWDRRPTKCETQEPKSKRLKDQQAGDSLSRSTVVASVFCPAFTKTATRPSMQQSVANQGPAATLDAPHIICIRVANQGLARPKLVGQWHFVA